MLYFPRLYTRVLIANPPRAKPLLWFNLSPDRLKLVISSTDGVTRDLTNTLSFREFVSISLTP